MFGCIYRQQTGSLDKQEENLCSRGKKVLSIKLLAHAPAPSNLSRTNTSISVRHFLTQSSGKLWIFAQNKKKDLIRHRLITCFRWTRKKHAQGSKRSQIRTRVQRMFFLLFFFCCCRYIHNSYYTCMTKKNTSVF